MVAEQHDARSEKAKQIYTLNAVEELYDISAFDLLKSAALGQLRLCIRVPPAVVAWRVYLPAIGHPEGRLKEGPIGWVSQLYDIVESAPQPVLEPVDALFLSQSDGVEILKQDVFHQNIFDFGIRFTGCNTPQQVYPVDLDAYLPKNWPAPCYWRLGLYPKEYRPIHLDGNGFDKPALLRLHIERLCVTKSDLCAYLASECKLIVGDDVDLAELVERYRSFGVDDKAHGCISLAGCDCNQLMVMRQAASRFCDPGNNTFLLPDEDNEKIEELLRKSEFFNGEDGGSNKKTITLAANVVRPDSWKKVTKNSERTDRRFYISPALDGLSMAWVVAWSGKEYVDGGPYYSTDEIADWLQDYVESKGEEMKRAAAINAAMIIRPSWDESLPGPGKRRRNRKPIVPMDVRWRQLCGTPIV